MKHNLNIHIILHILTIFLLILFYIWINPKLNAIERIVAIYKGFGEDYEKWLIQHRTEYRRIEKELLAAKEGLGDIARMVEAEDAEPSAIIDRLKIYVDDQVEIAEKVNVLVKRTEFILNGIDIERLKIKPTAIPETLIPTIRDSLSPTVPTSQELDTLLKKMQEDTEIMPDSIRR